MRNRELLIELYASRWVNWMHFVPTPWSDIFGQTPCLFSEMRLIDKTVTFTQQYRRLLLARLSSRCCQCWSDWWPPSLQVVAASPVISSGSGGMPPSGWRSTWTSSAGSWSRWRARGWTPGRSRGCSSCTAGTAQTSRRAGGKKYFLYVFFKMQELKCETWRTIKALQLKFVSWAWLTGKYSLN